MSRSEVICIVGTHRSGTSLVARLLHLCGLNLGPAEQLLGPDAANPLGHFEHRGFLAIDRDLLKHFGATWYDPPELEPGWQHDPKLAELLGAAKALAGTFPPSATWGWKEPRASLFLPFWKIAIPNMRFVICIRNPLEVARSLEVRNRIPIQTGASLWCRYTRAALEDTEGSPRLITFFEDFFDGGSGEIDRVVRFCGLHEPGNGSEIQSAVSAGLRHHTSEIRSLLEEPSVRPEAKLIYLGLRALLSARNGIGAEEESRDVGAFVRLFKELHGSEAAPGPELRRPAPARGLREKLKKLLSALGGS